MKSIILFLILVLLIFTGFSLANKQQYYPSKGEELVNSTLIKTAKIIKNKYNLQPCGSGAAMPGGPIQELTLCFVTKYPHTKEEMRKLLIKTSQDLLQQVIENKEIQEFLNERPFTIKNVEIVIYNHDEKGFVLKDPQVSVANISQALLTYRTIDPQNSFKYKNRYEESYEEALNLIKDLRS